MAPKGAKVVSRHVQRLESMRTTRHGQRSARYWILFYDYADDYLERRDAYRPDHLALAKAAEGRGELFLAGALADPYDRGILVFRAEDPAVVEAFVRDDPYVAAGLVTRWEIRKWNVVVGPDAMPT